MVLKRLREETRSHHERVERCFNLEARLADIGSYHELLERLIGIYEPLEAQLELLDWNGAGIDFTARRKTPMLKRDLAALSIEGRPGADHFPRADIPRFTSLAQGWGCMYVLEGATLGGQVISPMVRARLGLTAETGAGFFASYGEDVGRMWKAFCSAMSAQCIEEGSICAAVGAAVETFGCFEQRLRL